MHYFLAAEVEMYGGELDPNDPHAKQALEDEEAIKHGGKPKPHPTFWRQHRTLMISAAAFFVVAVITGCSRRSKWLA